MIHQIGPGCVIERQCPQRHVLSAGVGELGEVEVDGVDQFDRHRIVDDRIGPAGLGRGIFNVSSAVSDTPVSVAPSIFGSELTDANLRHAQALSTLSIVRRLRVVVDDL
jgi:hypothetical protein